MALSPSTTAVAGACETVAMFGVTLMPPARMRLIYCDSRKMPWV